MIFLCVGPSFGVLIDGFNYDLPGRFLFICKFRSYLAQISGMCTLTFIILPTIDCYLKLTTHLTFTTKYACRLIIGTIVFWVVQSIPTFIYFQIDTTTQKCHPKPGIFSIYHAVFLLIVFSLIPSSLLSIFASLTVYNLRKVHDRIPPSRTNKRIQDVNRELTRMLFVQVGLIIFASIPFACQNIYGLITVNNIKSENRLAWEHFAHILSELLIDVYCSTDFYQHICLSPMFRKYFCATARNVPFVKCYATVGRYHRTRQKTET
ncbi:unnamed protein product [Didymodactylos carnosus]|uniref:G-protein coupled receptors family 1 profile domain-containing protein n=1 Tax=Didymodactylos carnosus TaxID=1234261 RepID=A0A815YVM0_9BILA|nr:unnamed protein product [Didymodactylos carnosus]CAF1576820.1 unnamed protein product [Didymodactylos carnosus]CAF4258548.1 unnamed protein product [Didymodactylos carnosus]CAF4442249.1 unnamed protein product [Didymodactylos carnosus]